MKIFFNTKIGKVIIFSSRRAITVCVCVAFLKRAKCRELFGVQIVLLLFIIWKLINCLLSCRFYVLEFFYKQCYEIKETEKVL